MALQANGVDVGQVQQFGIVTAMRLVTGRAARLFYGRVFVHPGTGKIRVALQACGCLLRDARLKARFKCTVRIVTRGALYWTVIDLVMNGRREIGFDSGVALVAEGGLRGLQMLPFLACMNGVATDAADVGGCMSRLREVRVLGGVAREAFDVCLSGWDFGWIENLRRVPIALCVCLAIAVTALASDCAFLCGARFAVRIIGDMLDEIRVAGRAGGSLRQCLCRCGSRNGEYAEREYEPPVQ